MSKSIRGILIDKNKVLLIKRIKDNNLYYVFPGGHAEPGESETETCKREFKEETNIDVEVLKKVYTLKEGATHKSIYYLCTATYNLDTVSLKIIGPENKRKEGKNYYCPVWIKMNKLKNITLYPNILKSKLQAHFNKLKKF